jgi:hypothetical protein
MSDDELLGTMMSITGRIENSISTLVSLVSETDVAVAYILIESIATVIDTLPNGRTRSRISIVEARSQFVPWCVQSTDISKKREGIVTFIRSCMRVYVWIQKSFIMMHFPFLGRGYLGRLHVEIQEGNWF